MSDLLHRPMNRRAFCLGAGAAILTASPLLAEEEGEAAEKTGVLAMALRFFARLLGRSSGAGAGGAAAVAVAKSDPRPCGDLDETIRKDYADLERRERVIERKAAELQELEAEFAKAGGQPDSRLLTARHKQDNRRGWFRKDIKTHRADVASFNARCVTGEQAMAPHESYAPSFMSEG
ncbi:hypothetical protein ACQ5SO_00740 [Rhodovulum sp. DZ06]|uniref:hypothetical protein n=1 Tax=Rhodovulum sp. DZ06 TaxID=3425126 RepID=UPI003D350F02